MEQLTVKGEMIHLSGNLNTESAPGLFQHNLDFKAPIQHIDLQNIEDIDSAGLALLVHWGNIADHSSCRIEYQNVPQKLRDLAELCALGSLFATE